MDMKTKSKIHSLEIKDHELTMKAKQIQQQFTAFKKLSDQKITMYLSKQIPAYDVKAKHESAMQVKKQMMMSDKIDKFFKQKNLIQEQIHKLMAM